MSEPTHSTTLTAAGVDVDPAVELTPGTRLDHYRIRRKLGAGGMGTVYLAVDEILGRLVAIKLLESTTSAQRLLEEGRLTARMTHPNIVAVHGFGEHGDRPYLVLEHIEGESLRERTQRGRPSPRDAERWVRDVLEALVHAHEHGILHRDLKPSNVIITRDGRARVLDFGIAALVDSASARRYAGTPGYVAPEVVAGEPAHPTSDVYAVGVMLHELLYGQRPNDGRVVGGGPNAHVELIERCLGRAADRPTAAAMLAALDPRALRAGPAVVDERPPYRGLAPFSEHDGALFFGREGDVAQLYEVLQSTPVITVVAPSGAGKSSFLRAGLAARLMSDPAWTVVTTRPSERPFLALARALGTLPAAAGTQATPSSDDEIRALAAEFAAHPIVAYAAAVERTRASGRRLLLIVDQLEELLLAPEAEAEALLTLLYASGPGPEDPVRMLAGVRDDFVGRLPAIDRVFVLRPLDLGALRRAIVGPLELTGHRFDDPQLPDRIIADVAHVPSALPLVQFICAQLWERRDVSRRELRAEDYQTLGGVAGALALHADATLESLPAAMVPYAKIMLLRLVTDQGARRALHRDDVARSVPAHAAEQVVTRLVAARILVTRRAPDRGGVLVELSHESLARAWPTFRRWLQGDDEAHALIVQLADATQLWMRRGRRDAETWGADEIAQSRRQLQRTATLPSGDIEAFLQAGERRHAHLARRRRWAIGSAVGALLALTGGSLALAAEFRARAAEERRQAELQRLAGVNMGVFSLTLRPFDGVDAAGEPRWHDAATLPELSWTLFEARAGDLDTPGAPLLDDQVRWGAPTRTTSGAYTLDVEAPGLTAFVRLDGRHAVGTASCGPSWIRLQQLPGYARRLEQRPRIELVVPTCAATRAELVEVPAGPVVLDGVGVPPRRRPEEAGPERIVVLDAFAIDRVETSNADYAMFARMARWTGYARSEAPIGEAFAPLHAADHPVTGLDAAHALAYCRFMGKSLPSTEQWSKAARGGLDLPDGPNPEPRRLFPWLGPDGPGRTNVAGEDAWPLTAPVHALASGASPYGILQLSGNVAEWTSTPATEDGALRIVRGGSYVSPVDDEDYSAIYRNQRFPRYVDWAIGVRCAIAE